MTMAATMTVTAVAARARVLVVDDKQSVLELMERILGEAYEVMITSDPTRALALLARERFDVLLTDVRMPPASGFDLLAAARRCAQPPRVVMMTGYASIPDAVAAMRQGAFDYLAKPLEAEEISLVVARASQEPAVRPGGEGGEGGRDPAAPGRGEWPADVDRVDVDFHEAVAAARDRASHGYLVALMRQFQGNVTRAATRAGMTRESLHRLLRKYDVRSETFKAGDR